MNPIFFLLLAIGLLFVALHLAVQPLPTKIAMAYVAALAFLVAVFLAIPGLVKT